MLYHDRLEFLFCLLIPAMTALYYFIYVFMVVLDYAVIASISISNALQSPAALIARSISTACPC